MKGSPATGKTAIAAKLCCESDFPLIRMISADSMIGKVIDIIMSIFLILVFRFLWRSKVSSYPESFYWCIQVIPVSNLYRRCWKNYGIYSYWPKIFEYCSPDIDYLFEKGYWIDIHSIFLCNQKPFSGSTKSRKTAYGCSYNIYRQSIRGFAVNTGAIHFYWKYSGKWYICVMIY